MPKVLIVDDREEDRYIFKNFFNLFGMNSGIEILEASSGEEAVNMAQREKPDLILLDIKMETSDAGFVAAKKIREDQSLNDIIIWLVSSYEPSDEMSKEHCDELGCEDFLARPFNQVRLLQKLSEKLHVPIPHKTKMKMGLDE